MGLGSVCLLLLFTSAVMLSLARRQTLAPWIATFGVLLFLFVVATMMFGITFPYQTLNISVYLVFFVAVILSVAGGIGLVVRLANRWIST